MCIAYLAVNAHAEWPLFIAANRDEFHARPAQPAGFWPHAPAVIAGIDDQGGGTWLGLTRTGRFALITNYRDPHRQQADAPSRGDLAREFLQGGDTAAAYAHQVAEQAGRYNGFNLILGECAPDGSPLRTAVRAFYVSNRAMPDHAQPLASGRHVVSNHLLNTPWPKAQRLRAALDALPLHDLPAMAPDIFAILRDDTPADDHALPSTGLSLERERLLSSPFIVSPNYGTRCSTLVAVHRSGRAFFSELTYNPQGEPTERNDWPFHLEVG
ncbi:MAG: NRDE family protein [Burkholderiaceae bacterium]